MQLSVDCPKPRFALFGLRYPRNEQTIRGLLHKAWIHALRSYIRGLFESMLWAQHIYIASVKLWSHCAINSFAAFDCAEPFPSISGGSALYLESTDSDIEGAQVNYTCNRSCTLQGSFSLRCRVSVNNGHLMSEWIDDMGDSATPRCICQG